MRGDEGYVRARVVESNGRMAWCQPILVERVLTFDFLRLLLPDF
jgi:hypothetical protein